MKEAPRPQTRELEALPGGSGPDWRHSGILKGTWGEPRDAPYSPYGISFTPRQTAALQAQVCGRDPPAVEEQLEEQFGGASHVVAKLHLSPPIGCPKRTGHRTGVLTAESWPGPRTES